MQSTSDRARTASQQNAPPHKKQPRKTRGPKAQLDKARPTAAVEQPDPLVTRTYTLRLRGNPEAMRALWENHRAMTLGAGVFCDWLLTMGGGVMPVASDARSRLLVARTWLTVESSAQSPTGALESKDLPGALEAILNKRSLTPDEISSWVADCAPMLAGAIRDDAMWVDRSEAFDRLCAELALPDVSHAREDALMLWQHIFGPGVFQSGEGSEDENPASPRSSGAGMRTNHVFSHLFGGSTEGYGKTEDGGRHKLHYPRRWAEHLAGRLLALTNIHLNTGEERTEARLAGQEIRATGPFMREMFFRGAEALAGYRTKLRSQEDERASLRSGDQGLAELESGADTSDICRLLDDLRQELGRNTRAQGDYLFSRRALVGWAQLVAEWMKTGSVDERIRANARLQAEARDRKWGDASLFNKLAEDRFIPLWRSPSGDPRPEMLLTYAQGWEARRESSRRKVPAFRHPDPYDHPIFSRFGVSRPEIKFDPRAGSGLPPSVGLVLWDGKAAKPFTFTASSLRLCSELLPEETSEDSRTARPSRRTRLGALALNSALAERRALAAPVAAGEDDILPAGLDQVFEGSAAGTVLVARPALAKAHEREQRLPWQLSLSLDLQPIGPWLEFIKAHPAVISPDEKKGVINTAPRSPKLGRWRGLSYPFQREDLAMGRGGELSGLPGLRVLAVDLRQRFGAACALLEALTRDEFNQICAEATADARAARVEGLWAYVEGAGLFRRTGDDSSPTPWARVVYRTLVKLPGEEDSAVRPLVRQELQVCATIAELLDIPAPEPAASYTDALGHLMSAARALFRRQSALAILAANLRAGTPPANWKEQLSSMRFTEEELSRQQHLVATLAASRWREADSLARKVLRLLSELLQPRDFLLHAPRKGGLSITRITLLEDYYRLGKSYMGRPRPELPKGKPVEPNFALSLRQKIARLKRQRTRLLASVITARALGEDKHGVARYPYAHAVAIEDLTNFGFSATASRRSNRSLALWEPAAVRDALALSCQIHGLHLRQVEASYTSRQDSRTGRPGIRCREIPRAEFLTNSYWRRECERADGKLGTERETPRDRLLGGLRERLLVEGESAPGTVLVPAEEGLLLVAISPGGGVSKEHVGLAASVNIGLAALTDPAHPSFRWRIAAKYDAKHAQFYAAKAGAEALKTWRVPGTLERQPRGQQQIINVWRDLSPAPLEEGRWEPTPQYWRRHESAICGWLLSWRG